MALNWVMLDESRRPLPLPNEHTVMTVDKGADVTLEFPDAAGTRKKLRGLGRIWLTEQRLVFVATPGSGDSAFDSLSVPLLGLLSTSFVQPTFSANYLAVDIKPSPQGGLSEGTKAEIRLKDQPMIGFVGAIEKVRERALYMKRESAMGDDLPVYSSPSTSTGVSTQSASIQPPQPSGNGNQPTDAPPGYDTI